MERYFTRAYALKLLNKEISIPKEVEITKTKIKVVRSYNSYEILMEIEAYLNNKGKKPTGIDPERLPSKDYLIHWFYHMNQNHKMFKHENPEDRLIPKE